jgi:hypothetical protein
MKSTNEVPQMKSANGAPHYSLGQSPRVRKQMSIKG